MKYIVYLTINLVNNKIYVGVHGTETPYQFDGYYGNGVFKGDKLNNPQTPFQYAIKKYGFDNFYRITLKVFDTMQEALSLEAIIVNETFLKRSDVYNAVIGGGAPPVLNKEIYQYDINGNYIQSWFSIHAASQFYNIQEASIGRAVLYKRTSANFLWSDTKVDKLNIAEFNVYNRKTKIYAYDTEGKFVKSFDSISDFCRETGACLSHAQRSLKTGCLTRNYHLSLELQNSFIKPKNRQTGDIHMYNLNGEYIRSFSSVREAEEALHMKLKNLTAAISLDQAYKNFIWKRGEKLEKVELHNPPTKAKKIAQMDMQGNVIKVFDTLRDARKEFPNVSKVLNKTVRHCHGFLFKYYTD